MKSTAELLRGARTKAGLTQAELARRSGTKQSAVSAYESGRRDPNLATLRRLLASAGYALRLEIEEAATPPRGLPHTPLGRRLLQHRDEIQAVVAAHGGKDVRVFGSVARGEGGPDSDLDLLVDLPSRTGIFTIGRIAHDVERLVGVTTDVVPLAAVRPEIRQRVLDEAVPL